MVERRSQYVHILKKCESIPFLITLVLNLHLFTEIQKFILFAYKFSQRSQDIFVYLKRTIQFPIILVWKSSSNIGKTLYLFIKTGFSKLSHVMVYKIIYTLVLIQNMSNYNCCWNFIEIKALYIYDLAASLVVLIAIRNLSKAEITAQGVPIKYRTLSNHI